MTTELLLKNAREYQKDFLATDVKHARFFGFKHSGVKLIPLVNQLNPTRVLDAGCGHNLFKGQINNLEGLDVIDYGNNDYVCSIQDFKMPPATYDVILALGSLQYDIQSEIEKDLVKLLTLLKPNGVMILRAQIIGDTEENTANRYMWTFKDINYYTDKFNLTLKVKPLLDQNNNSDVIRCVWWWTKN